MELEMTRIGEASKISLNGRLDTPAVGQIETRFTASVVAPGRNTVVDLTQVTFLSSMGIRLLLTSARALSLKHATMVLFGAQPLVRAALDHVSLPAVIPLADDEAGALALLKAT
jgi:anti-sigma B factor antagonist